MMLLGCLILGIAVIIGSMKSGEIGVLHGGCLVVVIIGLMIGAFAVWLLVTLGGNL